MVHPLRYQIFTEHVLHYMYEHKMEDYTWWHLVTSVSLYHCRLVCFCINYGFWMVVVYYIIHT